MSMRNNMVNGKGNLMSAGARATFTIWAAAWVWDFFVVWRRWRGQTISEAIAEGLANPRTRIPVAAAITLNIVHVVALARHIHRGTSPGGFAMPFRSQR
jgi:hypothetical protein